MGKFTSTLYTEDNLFILSGMNSNLVDLIYLDPPFNSKRMYSAHVGSRAAGSSVSIGSGFQINIRKCGLKL